ncbi:sensor histidine kinase [Phaeocystidibacter marisrubri]|uniref:histidine kinase n=1 Tax=Phaeocystidibacter marisrubri TaxID=1577780 RepID=A0A6L3ZHZ7_9FLAO|nr:HAMP domain-containing sensor histidine kinase [Phaeocystidibacter marisrubri]KAB2817105.1 sensor histidine kinase [Phaeocystidibacter marisrubri]
MTTSILKYRLRSILLGLAMVCTFVSNAVVVPPIDTAEVSDQIWDMYWFVRDRPDSVRTVARELLAQTKQELPKDELGYLYEVIGDSYYMVSRYDSALHYFFLAREVYESIDDSVSLAYNSNYIGTLYNEIGMYDRAARQYILAKNIFTKSKNYWGLSTVNYGLSLIHTELEEYKKAAAICDEAIAQTLLTNDSMGLPSLYMHLSNIRVELGELDTALILAKLAIEYNLKYETGESERSFALAAMADVYNAQGKYQLAMAYADSAMVLAERIGDVLATVYFQTARAISYYGQGESERAWRLLQESAGLCREYGLVGAKRYVFRRMERLARSEEDWKLALTYSDSIKAMSDNVLNDNFDIVMLEEDLKMERERAAKLSHQQAIQDLTLERNTALLMLSIALALAAAIALYIQWKSGQRRNKLNEALAIRNSEIIQKNKELDVQKQFLEYNQKLLERSNLDKDKLLALISHDLRSPLAQVKSVTELILEGEIRENEQRAFFEKINESVDKSLGNLTEVLVWARAQMDKGITSSKGSVNVRESFQNAYNLVEEQYNRKKIECRMICPEPPPLILGDKSHMGTIFRNLLSNAAKFSNRESEVIFEVKQDSDFVYCSVEDHGVGMSTGRVDQILQEQVFDSTRGTERETGTGTGIQLVMEFIRLNDGKIFMESEIGVGTKVTVQFPKAK